MISRRSQKEIQPIKLHDYISIPKEMHIYSVGIEYMRNWFLDKFSTEYFKTVYINGKHIFDDYRMFNKERMTKQPQKPAVAIIPSVDPSYNRDTVDIALGGTQILSRRSRFCNDAVIQDFDNNIFLNMACKLVQMNFTFKIRLNEKAEQIDLYNYMKYAFRVGSTQGKHVTYDFLIPKEIMLNIAQSAGFELEQVKVGDTVIDLKIKNIVDFLKYVNSHSISPILYKMRTVNGKSEFFIRLPGLYTHISNLEDLSIDDGDRVDQTDTNFHIEMNCILGIPAPQYYYYSSRDKVDEKFKEKQAFAGLYEFKDMISPDKDEHGWDQYLSTEYFDDDRNIKKIEFKELLENHEFMWVVKRTMDTFISPKIFVSIKLFNNLHEIPIEVDWENFCINLLNEKELESNQNEITIYVDLEYLNEQLIVMKSMNETRMN